MNLDQDIRDIDFGSGGIRIKNVCEDHDIYTVKDLISHTEEELLRFRNFSRGSLCAVKNTLSQYGLYLKGDPRQLKELLYIARQYIDFREGGELPISREKLLKKIDEALQDEKDL